MTAQQPWLSILMPVHNAAPFLEVALRTILVQVRELRDSRGLPDSGTSVELLCFNDGSTDGSPDILQRLQREYADVMQVSDVSHSVGVSAARNALLKAARGTYVWFLDADDELAPGALNAVYRTIHEHEVDAVLCDYRVLRERSGIKHRLRGEHHRRTFTGPSNTVLSNGSRILEGLFKAGQWHLWSKVVRRACWPEDLEFPVGRVFEDLAVAPRLLAGCSRVWHLPLPLVAYRSNSSSILGTLNPNKVNDWALALQGMSQSLLLHNTNFDEPARQAMLNFLASRLLRVLRMAQRLNMPQQWQENTVRECQQASPALSQQIQSWKTQPRWWPAWFEARRRGLT